jgi:hypothetical protein
MLGALAACGLVLRMGLQLRRARRFRRPKPRDLRARHLRLAKPAVTAVCLGFIAGPISALVLRDWEPLRTFHAWIGVLAAALFVAAAVLGRRLERGRSPAFDAHALLGLLAMLAALIAAVAGFVLLP